MIATLPSKLKPRPQPGTCRRKCPGDRACVCDSNIYHRLHICRNERCFCHSKSRYEAERLR